MTDDNYHVIKASRVYTGVPYNGPTSFNKDATAPSFSEAVDLAMEMNDWNPVGWEVYSQRTGKCLFTTLEK